MADVILSAELAADFDTVDVHLSGKGSRSGERRRVWSSCMLETFTQTAGGGRARKTPGANMRFKVLHQNFMILQIDLQRMEAMALPAMRRCVSDAVAAI